MDRIDIYALTNIRGIGKSSGAFIWLFEFMTSKGVVTRNEKKSVVNVTARIAELMALIKALERITKPCEIMIHVSNSNLAKTLENGWIHTWAETGFINAKGEVMKDAALWQQFYDLFKQHTFLGVTCEPHTYTSWMQTELGIQNEVVAENRINTSYDTILKITEMVQSLDISEAEESEELTSAINTLCRAVFEKFKIAQICKNTGFLKIKNPQSYKTTSYSGNITITSADKQGISEEMESANAEK